jgi:abnormal spindle-like microcephaly-associated protein
MSIVPDYSNKVSASNTCKALQQHPSPVNAASKIKREPQEVSKMLGRMSLNVARPDVYTSTSSIAASRPRLSMMNKRTSIHGGSTLLKDTISSRRLEMRESKVKQFPLLADKLYNPELHDDGWINHQENAITHIVNAVFREADSSSKEPELCQPALRSRMLEVFDLPLVVELNKRLQAALQYGILRPQVSTDLSTDRTRDLGLRKHFIGLWMNNYNENLLRAAAEVVVGRTIPQSSPTSRFNSGASLDPHAERRTLVLFLESFFIDGIGMDHHFDADATAVAEARERKTLQRSLMLIWLLDRTKGAGLVSTLLFKPKAQLKSSAAVIKHLGKMLIPNTPELVRALNMLDYEVVHVQLSLSEVNYHIDNIAVDLRDGIFLTRLVELVALDKKTGTTCNESHLDFSMPDGGMLSEMDITSYRDASTQHSQDSISILSRHLRLPCLGNAPKLHNIQLALNAFNAACCQDNLPPTSVEASDILNGHREKTLHLLWQLVSQYGLSQLVNMNELLSDIKQTGDDTSFLSSTLTACFSREDQEVLLQSWATVHAAERGTIVTNLTTSFASANVWSALCEAYSPFSNTSTESTSLESRLRALGCSLSWIQHLLSTLGRIPNRVTTLSNLGYFASVVLPLARRFRHVTTLQRVWRARQAKKMLSARIRHMRAGRDCAAVAKTQNMVVDAAVVIQRAWRGVVERRIERLNEDVVGFQALAKGWMGRRKGRANRIVRNAW